MDNRIYIDVFDYSGKKIASLYDSGAKSPGSINSIEYITQLNGNRTLSFALPYMADGVSNWRWKYIKSEYKVRLIIDDFEDWFIITNPKKNKASKKIDQEITCEHLSMMLKTKNLYLYFDEENGIGTAPYLMNQILEGTDWTFDEDGSDIFYESYGETSGTQIKSRSLSSDSKEGAYALIGKVCDLFNAYPVFDASKKTVALHDLNNKLPVRQMMMGVNLSSLSVEYNSSDIITRLYVQGDYDDDDYVSISSVNPYGLSYLLNFDYYKSIGAFTDEHQEKLDQYYADILEAKSNTLADSTALMSKSSQLSALWGTQDYVLWTVTDGSRVQKIVSGSDVEESETELAVGDKMYVFYHDDSLDSNKDRYKIIDVGVNTSMMFDALHYPFIGNGAVTHVMKWITPCSGSIGAKEVALDAKQEVIDGYREQNERETTDESTKSRNNELITAALEAMETIRLGDSNNVQTFTYEAKVTGDNQYKSGDTIATRLTRTSTESAISSAAYYMPDAYGVLSTDETVQTYSPDTRLKFGIYGNTGKLDQESLTHAMNLRQHNIGKEILDCTTAGKDLTIEVVDDSSDGNVIRLNGTTFTIAVQACAYGLYEQYAMAVKLAVEVDSLTKSYNEFMRIQNQIEAQFMIDMGDMLKDGYWTDDNYIAGQEQYLYNDALDVMKEVSKPKVTYTVSMIAFADEIGMERDHMELNTKVRIYDPELDINDVVYVSKITKCIDDPSKSSVEISNEQVDVSSSFDSIFSRISDIAKLIEQKKTIFDRAKSLTSKGSLATERLEGAIDLLTTQLSSSVSSWYTDDAGNIIFESVDGSSAMQLCGDGWMIANGKTAAGRWNWRSAATGKGIVADSILTGYLSADRIQAGSITASKLSSDVGESLDLSSNKSVRISVQDVVLGKLGYKLSIVSENGLFIRDDCRSLKMTALLTDDGNDVTYGSVANIRWLKDGVLKASGTKEFVVDSAIVSTGAVIRCEVVLPVDSGKKDLFGAVIYEDRLFYDEVAVTNLQNAAGIRVSVHANHPLHQVFNPNIDGGYRPDWQEDPLILEPMVTIDNIITSVGTRNDVNMRWIKYVDGVATPMTNMETVNDLNGTLTVRGNMMTAGKSSRVSYQCYVEYYGTTVYDTTDFELHVSRAEGKHLTVSGGHVFTYKNGVCNPNSITLTANISNVNFAGWNVLTSNGTFEPIERDTSIVIENTDSLFVGDVCTLMAISDDPNVYDVYKIYKVTDAASGTDKTYHCFIRYSGYEDGFEMKMNPSEDTKYIGVYVGPVINADSLSAADYMWSKYTSSSIEIEKIVVEYNRSSSDQTTVDDTKWSQDVPEMDKGDFLWVRTTVKFTGESMQDLVTTYAVYYSGLAQSFNTGQRLKYQTYVRYSAESTGRNMTMNPDTDTAYIGFYTGVSTTAPTSYAVYSWYSLNRQEKKIAETSVSYGVSDNDNEPTEWSDEIPPVKENEYMWLKTRVTFSDGTGYDSYRRQYSGTEGTNKAIAFLTNSHVYIPAYYNGRCAQTRVITGITAYGGIQKIAPIIEADQITYIGIKPIGMSVSVGEYDAVNGQTSIVLTVNDGANLGGDDSLTGDIIIPVSMTVNGMVTTTRINLTWHKINRNYSGDNTVVFDLYTPQTSTIDEGTPILLKAFAYDGGNDISEYTDFHWYSFERGAWNMYDYRTDEFGHNETEISADQIASQKLFKCVMSYNNKDYVKMFRVSDMTDDIQTLLVSSGNGTIDKENGNLEIVCMMRRYGFDYYASALKWYRIDETGDIQLLDMTSSTIPVNASDIVGDMYYGCETPQGDYAFVNVKESGQRITSGTTAPSNPSAGDMWLDTSVVPNVLMCWVLGDANEGTSDRWVSITEQVVQSASEQIAELYVNKDEIAGYVKRTSYDEDLKTITQQIGKMTMDEQKFQILFSTSGVADSVSKEVNKYLRYSDGKLTLGSQGDEKERFKTELTQDKLSFVYTTGGREKEVAYIGANDMYITNARVTDALYLGDKDVGFFNWTVTENGLGLKWVGKDV